MAPLSRRVKNARAIPREHSRFAKNAEANTNDTMEVESEDDASLAYFDELWDSTIDSTIAAGARAKRPVVYTGDSERTKRRKKAEITHTLRVCPMSSIRAYFGSSQSTFAAGASRLDAPTCVTRLEEKLHQAKAVHGPRFVQICLLIKFYELRVDGKSRTMAAYEASGCLPSSVRKSHSTIRLWARNFEATGELPSSSRGCHQKSR